MNPTRIVLGFLLLLQAACVSRARTTITPLPAFQDAVAMADPEHPENPPVITEGPYMEEVVPYARIGCVGSGTEQLATTAWEKAIPLMPNLLMFFDQGAQQVGAVNTYWGMGIATSENVYKNTASVLLARVTPCVLPFIAEVRTGMVQVVQPSAKSSGLLEGDTVLSVGIGPNGADIPWNDQFFLRPERLHLKTGQQVHVVAMREGAGRVEATVTMVENPATYRNAQRLIDTTRRNVYTVTKSGKRVWSTSSWVNYDN